MKLKKILTLMCCAVLLVCISVGATVAYLTSQDTVTNTFTVGNVSIVLNEPNWDQTGAAEAFDVYPGEALAKDPTVTNDGKNPCFVRISVTNLDQFAAEFNGAQIIYRTDYVDNALGTNWVKGNDGYFYYSKVLNPGETTDALFDQIVIPKELTNDAPAKDIVVTAYAVQAQGARPSFADVQTMTVAEIAEWMNTCLGLA